MDVILVYAAIGICLLLIIVGLLLRVKFVIYAGTLGLFLLGIMIAGSPLTYQVPTNETTSFIYGNQTIQFQVLNESENVTSSTLPWIFTAINTPLVAGSDVCYYTDNATALNSEIININLGTINITS